MLERKGFFVEVTHHYRQGGSLTVQFYTLVLWQTIKENDSSDSSYLDIKDVIEIDNMLPIGENLTAVTIMFRIKDRAIGNSPTEENFEFLFRKIKLGINYHDIDDYFIKIHTLNQQIKFC